METTEFWRNHQQLNHPNFCKAYSAWKRITHSHYYLACMFGIQDLLKHRYATTSHSATSHSSASSSE